jgi:predicted nucleic acid-binding protein
VQREVGLPHLPWVNVVAIRNQEALRFLKFEIDEGEAATIILATEIKGALLILDEKKARKIARRLDLKVTGLMGVLMKAKEKGIIGAVRELIVSLEEADFRISEEIKQKVLRLCGE